jgi:hypothetical protein
MIAKISPKKVILSPQSFGWLLVQGCHMGLYVADAERKGFGTPKDMTKKRAPVIEPLEMS